MVLFRNPNIKFNFLSTNPNALVNCGTKIYNFDLRFKVLLYHNLYHTVNNDKLAVRFLYFFALAILGITQFSCVDKTKGIKDIRLYYYPSERLYEGRVYEYTSNTPGAGPIYRYFQTSKNGDSSILVSQQYNAGFRIQSLSTEKIVRSGILAKSQINYTKDSTGQREIGEEAEILRPTLFPFMVEDSNSVYIYKISWRQGNGQYTLTRNRRYIGDTIFLFKESEYSVVKFLIDDLVDHDDNGHLTLTFQGEEWYAKGIGLVRFFKKSNGKLLSDYQLSDIYPMQKLEKIAQKPLQNQ
jgi:hypothetical protein